MNNDEKPIEALVVRDSGQVTTPTVWGTAEPIAIIGKATEVASALKGVIKAQGLISNISGKEYPRCEAWTLLGTMLGIFPVCQWTKQVEGGWEARVEARTRDGSIVGSAEAQCLRSERNWANRDDFALRSMAQTRATAKALRMPLGFVMTLAGYEPTPAEEMGHDPKPPARPPCDKPAAAHPVGLSTDPKDTPAFLERCKAKLVGQMPPGGYCDQYGYDAGMILDNEKFADATVSKLFPVDMTKSPAELAPMVKAIAEEHLRNVRDMAGMAEQDPPEHDDSPPRAPRDDESWRDVIVPIPHKGQKRDDYLKDPDTIGSLYDARHEDEGARKRLWGFVTNYEPKGWTKRDGTEMPPSSSDKAFRVALDQFQAWFAKNHPEEKL